MRHEHRKRSKQKNKSGCTTDNLPLQRYMMNNVQMNGPCDPPTLGCLSAAQPLKSWATQGRFVATRSQIRKYVVDICRD